MAPKDGKWWPQRALPTKRATTVTMDTHRREEVHNKDVSLEHHDAQLAVVCQVGFKGWHFSTRFCGLRPFLYDSVWSV
jgi:hypothetical protein